MTDNLTAGAMVARPAVLVDFTDGDTWKRITIVDSFVNDYTKVFFSIRRTDIAEVDDPGWIYIANVASMDPGTFDVNLQALPIDAHPTPNNDYPNETITLFYSIAN